MKCRESLIVTPMDKKYRIFLQKISKQGPQLTTYWPWRRRRPTLAELGSAHICVWWSPPSDNTKKTKSKEIQQAQELPNSAMWDKVKVGKEASVAIIPNEE